MCTRTHHHVPNQFHHNTPYSHLPLQHVPTPSAPRGQVTLAAPAAMKPNAHVHKFIAHHCSRLLPSTHVHMRTRKLTSPSAKASAPQH